MSHWKSELFNTEIASRFKIQALAQTIHQSAKSQSI